MKLIFVEKNYESENDNESINQYNLTSTYQNGIENIQQN